MVIRVGENTLGGHTVMVMGPAGYRHYYAHLDRPSGLSPGSWLKAGDVIGVVGSSGNARGTPPHLHYGVYRPSGEAVNPYSLLRRGEAPDGTGPPGLRPTRGDLGHMPRSPG